MGGTHGQKRKEEGDTRNFTELLNCRHEEQEGENKCHSPRKAEKSNVLCGKRMARKRVRMFSMPAKIKEP